MLDRIHDLKVESIALRKPFDERTEDWFVEGDFRCDGVDQGFNRIRGFKSVAAKRAVRGGELPGIAIGGDAFDCAEDRLRIRPALS